MTKQVRIQLYEAIVRNCQELLSDPQIENGGRTTVQEMIALAKGRIKSLIDTHG